jgi:HEAT repeat protein
MAAVPQSCLALERLCRDLVEGTTLRQVIAREKLAQEDRVWLACKEAVQVSDARTTLENCYKLLSSFANASGDESLANAQRKVTAAMAALLAKHRPNPGKEREELTLWMYRAATLDGGESLVVEQPNGQFQSDVDLLENCHRALAERLGNELCHGSRRMILRLLDVVPKVVEKHGIDRFLKEMHAHFEQFRKDWSGEPEDGVRADSFLFSPRWFTAGLSEENESWVEAFLWALEQSDPAVRGAAGLALGELHWRRPFRETEPLIRALVRESDSAVRWAIIVALGRIDDLQATVPLCQLLHSECNSRLREEVARALGHLGDARAVEPLINALEMDPDVSGRCAAAAALGWLCDKRSLEPLARALRKRGSPPLRRASGQALAALGAIKPLRQAFLSARSLGSRRDAAEALARVYNWEAATLLAQTLIRSRKGEVQRIAVEALRNLGETEESKAPFEGRGPEFAKGFLEDDGPSGQRAMTLETLTRVFCKHEDRGVRCGIAWILGQLGDNRAAEPLAKALRTDSNWQVRMMATKALVKLNAVQQLAQALLEDGDPEVRQVVAGAMVAVGVVAIDPLTQALRHEDDSAVRQRIGKALKELRAVESFVGLVQADNVELRRIAVDGLWELGDARAVNQLVHALTDADAIVRKIAAQTLARFPDSRVINPLIRALRDPDVDVRIAVASALGRRNDPWALESLQRACVTDPSSYVRTVARLALADGRATARL